MRRFAAPLLVFLLIGPLALLPWNGDDAISALRARLRTRGYTTEVTGGPMIALWSDEAPAHPLVHSPALPASLRRADAGAYLVVTEGGDWWVWSNGLDSGPLRERPTLLD
jgi:hypothetical protein